MNMASVMKIPTKISATSIARSIAVCLMLVTRITVIFPIHFPCSDIVKM